MIKKRYLILILCIITILSIQFVSANDNTDDINVLGASEDGNVLQAPTETKSYTDLKNVIDQAGDEISLEYNYKFNNEYGSTDPKTGINITRNLVINGNGAVIDGASASSLFNISEGVTVTLKNLTITHANYNGGYSAQDFVGHFAINSQGILNIIDCTFENNKLGYEYADHLDFNGSVIKSTNDVNIENSVFSNNCVPNSGIIYTTGRVSVKGSQFENNAAYGKNYKGAVIYTEGGIDLIDNCTFSLNGKDSKGSGGAIYIANSNSVTSIKNSSFKENYAMNGGAVYTDGAVDLVENCNFTGNKASQGSAIYISRGNFNMPVVNSTFVNNKNGNAIFTHGPIGLIENSTFKDNGGAIYTDSVSSDISVRNSTFERNNGAIYTNGKVDVIEDSTFKNNAVTSGSAVYIGSGSSLTSVRNSTFESNGNGAVGSYGGAINTNGGIDVIVNSTFKGNKAIDGGAIYIDSETSITSIKNSTFEGDSTFVGGAGGAINTNGMIDLIENSTFKNLNAEMGGAISIFNTGSITSIKNSTFIGAKNYLVQGGAINTIGVIDLIEDSTFRDLYANYGGAICIVNGNSNTNIRNSTFENNGYGTTDSHGGAVYTEGNLEIENLTMKDNSAIIGGAIYAAGNVAIKNSTMENNYAVNGSVVYAEGSVNISEIDLIANNGNPSYPYTEYGGVIYAKENVNIINTNFGANYATAAGGAIYSEGNVNFYNSKVDGSAATNDGNGDGGFIYAKGNVNIENSTIESVYMKVASQGKQFSGAVFTEGNIVVKNSNFTKINNDIHSIGGAIRALGNAEIYNSNFTDNKAVEYAALYVDGTLDVYDSYFYNNTNSVAFAEGRTVVNNTKFVNNTCDVSLNGRVLGSNSTLNITNSVIDGTNSHGSQFKGSVFSDGNVFVDNCNFTNSFALEGGSRGLLVYTNSNATVLNSYFNHNSYEGHTCFGGIYSGQNTYVENCTFINATVIGGYGQTEGLCVYAEHNISFINSSIEDFFSRNTHEGALSGNYVYVIDSNFTDIAGFGAWGAAIHANIANVSDSNFYLVRNNDFADNGGGIYANNTYAYRNNFTSCTGAAGAAIFSENYTEAIENIFINNTVHYGGGAIFTKNGFMEYNVFIANGKSNKTQEWGDLCDIAIADGSVDSLELNWWGLNDPFGIYGQNRIKLHADPRGSQGIQFLPDTWVLMDFYINPNQELVGEGVNLTTTLDTYLNKTETEGSNIHDLAHNIAKRTVLYKAINKTAEEKVGWFSHDSAIIINQDYVLYSNNNFLKHNVSSTIDYQTLYLDVAQFYVNVTKTVTDLTPEVDDEITYTILINNTDTTDYSDPSAVIIHPSKINITITDKLDPRLKFISANDTNYNPETGEWFIENLTINGTIALTITVKVLKGGNITNYANVTKINDDVLTEPYGANVTIQVPLVYKLKVNKTVDINEIGINKDVTFTINVTNVGSGNLTHIVVNDKLPTGLTFKSSNATGYNPETGELIIGQLGEDQSFVFTIVATTTTKGTFINNATAKSNENETLVKSNATVTVTGEVILNITKKVNVTKAFVGDKLNYTIVVSNNGTMDATGVNVTDIFDSSLVEVIVAESSADYNTVVANGWRIDSLPIGESRTLYLVVKIIGNGTIVNTVTANSTENKTSVTNKSDDVEALPDVRLSIDKTITSDVSNIHVGDSIVYEITVTNNGNSTATGINVTETLSGLVVVTGADTGGAGSWNNTTKVWNIPSLVGNGAKATLTLTVSVINVGTVTNAVVAKASENDTEVTDDAPDVEVKPDVKLVITKDLDTALPIYAGDNITYTIVITNNGLSEATNVKVTDIVKGMILMLLMRLLVFRLILTLD